MLGAKGEKDMTIQEAAVTGIILTALAQDQLYTIMKCGDVLQRLQKAMILGQEFPILTSLVTEGLDSVNNFFARHT